MNIIQLIHAFGVEMARLGVRDVTVVLPDEAFEQLVDEGNAARSPTNSDGPMFSVRAKVTLGNASHSVTVCGQTPQWIQ